MLKVSRSALLVAASAVVIVPLSGCAVLGKKKGETAYVARDVNTLYAAAKRTMDARDYELAAKLFDEVERQHPYSVWARRAQLMSAFNYYLARKYNDAIASARRFVTIHPGNAEAPYAQYLISMSYYQQMEDVTRDQSITQSAKDAFGELIRRYPDTRYAADARVKLDLINDHLAGKEMEIGRFYQRSGNWLAASYRFRSVVDNYKTTSHVPEALERLVETSLALGLPEEARETAAVLGYNYPETYWYRQSLRLLIKSRDKNGRLAVASATSAPAAEPEPPRTSPTRFPPVPANAVPPPPGDDPK
ncbi:MAG TPA: outer membrane protein assembly factor BamD [Sphingomicrobium sp.]|nr:outer membrane protein assembly factor BamD [Sphingomicrobium sp.]